jgi:hypothetical protein
MTRRQGAQSPNEASGTVERLDAVQDTPHRCYGSAAVLVPGGAASGACSPLHCLTVRAMQRQETNVWRRC